MRAVLAFAFLFLFIPLCASAETIVFVSEKESDSKSVRSIVNGIRNYSGSALVAPVSDLNNYTDYSNDKNDRFVIIGADLVAQSGVIPDSFATIGAGFYLPPIPNLSIDTLSLYPDTNTIVSEIRKTGFEFNTIRTVVSSTTLKDKLETDSSGSGYRLIAELATSERDTARSWFELLRDINPDTDALLISDSSFLDSSGSYRSILETAWRRNILVVSALPQYSTRGVSIGFIPDLVSYGESIAASLDNQIDAGIDRNIRIEYLTTDVLVRVFNERTLSHVGYVLPGDLDRLKRDDMVIE